MPIVLVWEADAIRNGGILHPLYLDCMIAHPNRPSRLVAPEYTRSALVLIHPEPSVIEHHERICRSNAVLDVSPWYWRQWRRAGSGVIIGNSSVLSHDAQLTIIGFY